MSQTFRWRAPKKTCHVQIGLVDETDMSEEEQVLDVIKRAIASMPAEDRDAIHGYADVFRAILQVGGSRATVALGLVGAEGAV